MGWKVYSTKFTVLQFKKNGKVNTLLILQPSGGFCTVKLVKHETNNVILCIFNVNETTPTVHEINKDIAKVAISK